RERGPYHLAQDRRCGGKCRLHRLRRRQSFLASGTVYLDYPDIGISRMEVLGELEGRRTVSMTLYNASPATLAGDKDREVKLSFYTDNLLTETADVTCTSDGVAVSGNTLTISGENALRHIDEG